LGDFEIINEDMTIEVTMQLITSIDNLSEKYFSI